MKTQLHAALGILATVVAGLDARAVTNPVVACAAGARHGGGRGRSERAAWLG